MFKKYSEGINNLSPTNLRDLLEFRKVNLAEDELPVGDIAFGRQVLQHLSNREIVHFAEKLNLTKPYKYIVITEHLPFSSNFIPNVDKPSGPNNRVAIWW